MRSSQFPTKNHCKASAQPQATITSQAHTLATTLTPILASPRLHEIHNRAVGGKAAPEGTWLHYFNSKPHAVRTKPPMSTQYVVVGSSSKGEDEMSLIEAAAEICGGTVDEMDKKVVEALRKSPQKSSPKNEKVGGQWEKDEKPTKDGTILEVKTWNLRPRKCKKLKVESVKKSTTSGGKNKAKFPKDMLTFTVSLSTKDTEDDKFRMGGLNPAEIHQNMPNDVQTTLDE